MFALMIPVIGTTEIAEIGAYADMSRLRALADHLLADAQVEVVGEPERGLVMLQVEEPVEGAVFTLGELLVTRCELAVDGERGVATILGDDPARAIAAAVLDAAARRPRTAHFDTELERELASVRQQRAERWARLAPTRVDLEESA